MRHAKLPSRLHYLVFRDANNTDWDDKDQKISQIQKIWNYLEYSQDISYNVGLFITLEKIADDIERGESKSFIRAPIGK